MSLTGAMSLVVNVAPPSVETAYATESVLPLKVSNVKYTVPVLLTTTVEPWSLVKTFEIRCGADQVRPTKWVDQLLPPSVERDTATEFAASVRSKAILAYQNVPLGPATTAGSPADSYGPGAAALARTSPGRNPADQVVPPSGER